MLDWEGNLNDRPDRQQILLANIDEDDAMAASVYVGSIKVQAIDVNLRRTTSFDDLPSQCYQHIPREADQVASVLGEVSPILDDQRLYNSLKERAQLGKFQASIGSTNVTDEEYLVDDEDDHTSDESDDSSLGSEQLLDDLFEKSMRGDIDLDEIMVSASHAAKAKGIDAHHLSKTWRINLDSAQQTLDVTTQSNVRKDNPTLSRNYGTNDRMLRYKHIKEYFFMDTFFSTKKAGKSSRGNTCCQLFVTDKGFVYVVPMKSKAEVLQAVKQFAKEVGAPDAIISDAASEQKSQALRKFCSDIGTTLRHLEEGTPWANKAELYIGLIKEAVRKDMKESPCPLAFWDYCVQRRARINNLTAKDNFHLRGTNAHTLVTGEEGDISNLCQYKWYDWCYFREHKERFPFNREVLGRVLGPATGAGNEMAQWILKSNGNVIPRRTLRPLHIDETHSPDEQKKREIFDALIERRWGNSISPPTVTTVTDGDDEEWQEYEDDDEPARIIPDVEDAVDANG
jgi:transposase InsO family protein